MEEDLMSFNGIKPIVAITGSSGKTTVKTLISAVLRERWVVFESNDYNNTTEKTKEHAHQFSFIHRAAVLEYGMAYPGVITEHCNIIRPNIGVITNVGLAHIGNFQGKVEQLAAAKSELIRGLSTSGILFVNSDDPNSKLLDISSFSGKVFTVSIDTASDYQARRAEYSEQGMTFMVTLDRIEYKFLIPILGIHNIYNALFAIGVAHQLGFLPSEIQTGLESVRKPNHRLDIHHLRDGIIVIDDTVHAHPPAMKAAIDVLSALSGKKKIAILGSMPELGEKADEYHKDVGRYLSSKGIDFLYTYGNISVDIGIGAIEYGFQADKVKHKTPLYRKVLHRELIELIEPGSVILIKGASRLGMFETVKFLTDYYKVK
jgi:UDP-N-acetylmuramoyl-tripeptide--D-alanyl-D-alanine ligase